MKFAILISTRNRREDLLLTLEKSRRFIEREAVEFVVFDDGSIDGTYQAVRDQFPNVVLHRNKQSKGYIFCRNAMLNQTTADFAISLDDDAHFLTDDPLDQIQRYFNENPKCGVAAFRIFWGATPPETTATTLEPTPVKGFVGCGHAWRIKAWRDIRPYPEWFEFYGEESFASLELFAANWQVNYLPQVLVWHRVNMKSRRTMPGFSMRYRRAIRADWHLYFLFFPWGEIPKKMAYSLWMQFKKVLQGQFNVVAPVARALLDVVWSLPKYRANRRAFSKKDFARFNRLKETKIYWKPENDL